MTLQLIDLSRELFLDLSRGLGTNERHTFSFGQTFRSSCHLKRRRKIINGNCIHHTENVEWTKITFFQLYLDKKFVFQLIFSQIQVSSKEKTHF